MDQKPHSFSAIVTIAILGVLTVVAWLYKIGKNQEAQVLKNEVTATVPFESTAPATPRDRQFVPAAREEIKNPNYEVLLGCELVESRANDGNTFRVRHRDNEYVFRLYFVDAPETTNSSPDRIRSQTKYFNYITEQQLLETGIEAREFALKILRTRPFTVFTQWDKLLQSHRFYGMIQVTTNEGERRFLSEFLSNRGYAAIETVGRKLPNGVEENVYRTHLRGLEEVAQKARVGAWRDLHQ
ncbi:MAG: thermonuclease family protein [Verrucomicrobiales bacterium]